MAVALAGTANAGEVYVANQVTSNVSVINPTNTVIATITVGSAPVQVAVAPAGQVYVTNYANNTVSVISGASNAVIATITVGLNPVGIAVS